MRVNNWDSEDETSGLQRNQAKHEQVGSVDYHSSDGASEDVHTIVFQSNKTVTGSIRRCCSRVPPPGTKPARYILIALVCLFAWGTLYSVIPVDAMPGGHIFSLMVLVFTCWVLGEVVTKLRLPALLGMLIAGIAFRNIPYYDLTSYLRSDWSAALRTLSVVIIMTRAGLGLDPEKLKSMKWLCLRLACLPCVSDGLAAGAVAHWLLGYPIMGSLTFGFVMAGLSPAVIVPLLITFQEKGLGVAKGIPTLGIFAVGVDNVVAMCLFGIFLSITFTDGALWFLILSGPLQIVIGIIYGVVMGIISWYLPNTSSKWVVLPRFALLFSGCLFAVFYSKQRNLAGAGVIGALVFALVAAYRWRQDNNGDKAVAKIFGVLWQIIQPVLFGLIGAQIDLSSIRPEVVGYGMAAMFIGITARMLAAGLSMINSGFNWREIIFIELINVPKATVQAAVGGLVLDAARQYKAGSEAERMGSETLTMAALSILICSTLGGVLMMFTADKLLGKNSLPADVSAEMATVDEASRN